MILTAVGIHFYQPEVALSANAPILRVLLATMKKGRAAPGTPALDMGSVKDKLRSPPTGRGSNFPSSISPDTPE